MKEIATSDLQPTTTPGDGWYIIEAAGEHATRVEDAELTQRLTPEVLAAVAAAGVPAEGLPIDRDHLSLDAENSTEAMGWVRELAMCGGNLAARIEWTSLGLPLITGRVYKHFSTVYPAPTAEQLAAGVYEPAQLIGLALTNQPNNREGQPPITNHLRLTIDDVRLSDNGEQQLADGGEAHAGATARALGADGTASDRERNSQIVNRKSYLVNKCNQYAHDPGCPDAEGGSAGTQDADLDDTPDSSRRNGEDEEADEMPEDADEELQERYMEASSMASAGVDREEIFAVTGVDVGKTDIDREYEDMVAAGADERAIYKQTGIDPRRYEKRRAKRRAARSAGQKPAVANSAEDFSEGKVPEEANKKTTEQEPTMFSPELLAALGLAEGATEQEVLAAVQALKEQAEVANTAAKQAEAAEAEAVINAAEKEAGVELSDEEREEAKQQIITNRKHGLKYVGLLCRDKRAVTNTASTERRYAGKTPLANRTAPADPEQAIANRAQQLCDEARAAGRPIGYFTAVEKARAEHARELNRG